MYVFGQLQEEDAPCASLVKGGILDVYSLCRWSWEGLFQASFFPRNKTRTYLQQKEEDSKKESVLMNAVQIHGLRDCIANFKKLIYVNSEGFWI